jgi:hypothetical protein
MSPDGAAAAGEVTMGIGARDRGQGRPDGCHERLSGAGGGLPQQRLDLEEKAAATGVRSGD